MKADDDDEQEDMSPDDLWATFDAYVVEASRLKKEKKDEIALLVGLETELIDPSTSFSDLEKVLARHGDEIDYLVGSVHHVAGVPIDFDRPTFDLALKTVSRQGQRQGDPLHLLFCDYFDAQLDLIERFRPQVIGHFDLCRLHHPHERLDTDDEVWTRVVRNVRKAVEYGALFEVNTAALRKGWPTPYPGPEVLRVASIFALHLLSRADGRDS